MKDEESSIQYGDVKSESDNLRRKISRKEFLKTIGIGSAALGGLGLLTAKDTARAESNSAVHHLKSSKQEGVPLDAPGIHWDDGADIVVLGGGGAGMMAALEANAAGLKAIIIEKGASLGGDTALSGGVLYAAGTQVQRANHVLDSRTGLPDNVDSAFSDWKKAGGGAINDELVGKIIKMSPGFVDYFETKGVQFILYQSGNDPVHRGHVPGGGTPQGGRGLAYTIILADEVQKAGIAAHFETKALDIVRDGQNRILGVKAQHRGAIKYIRAKAIVLATGGNGANLEMTMRYNPEAIHWVNIGSPLGTGDGITMAEKLNARFVGFQNKFDPVAPSIVIGVVEGPGLPDLLCQFAYAYTRVAPRPFIFVDHRGKRFVNEGLGYNEGINFHIATHEGGFCWCVFDQALYEEKDFVLYGVGGSKEALADAVIQGVVRKAGTLDELAQKMDIDPGQLHETINRWNTLASSGKDTDFERVNVSLGRIGKAPFYAYKLVPGAPTPYIGANISVDIDKNCQVLDRDGSRIPGLYAAGVGVAGFRMLGRGYPGSGSAIASGLATGRIAGKAAAAEVADGGKHLRKGATPPANHG